jgi:N-terminal domain of anti-restriction factor ArdC
MAKRSSHRCSETARAERRRADRERLRRAAQELLSSQGWARWVRVRAMFRTYSAGNCMLLAQQCHERGIVPERVAGFRAWLKLGRCVRKGETALRILAPVTVTERDELGRKTERRCVFFKTAFVFELSQTEPLPGVEPVALEPPHEPLSGNSHAHLIPSLRSFAASLGYPVSFGAIPGSAGGWCDAGGKRIVIDAKAPANGQLRTLIHECAHALGVDYERYSRAQAEVIVDTVTFIVAAGVGLEVGGESIPYVAGWGEEGALEAVSEFAETIDTIARRIESALSIGAEEGM